MPRVETDKDPEEKPEAKKQEVGGGERDQQKRKGNPEKAPSMDPPVIQPSSRVDDHDLENQGRQQAEIGEQADLGISVDNGLLAVKDREGHRNRNGSRIIEAVE